MAPFITPTPNELYCPLAEQTYLELCATGSWSDVTTKGTKDPVGLMAGGQPIPKSPPMCWNCGKIGHIFPTCPKPKNEMRIAEHKAQACKGCKKGGGTPQNKVKNANKQQGDAKDKDPKWVPPTSAENNKHIIDGTPCFWNPHHKRWYVDKRAIEAAQVVQPAPALVPPASTGPSEYKYNSMIRTLTLFCL